VQPVLTGQDALSSVAACRCWDPSKTIQEIGNVHLVFKDGAGFDSKNLIESDKGKVGIR
jgi:hypothetical protein